VKPNDEAQGRGIYITRDESDIKAEDVCVVQKYIHKPHLIDGYKYDLRIYVIVTGIAPLRVYLYRNGLARFATKEYIKPTDENIKD
jgi:tubulin polyglutamylase TTLL6/13